MDAAGPALPPRLRQGIHAFALQLAQRRQAAGLPEPAAVVARAERLADHPRRLAPTPRGARPSGGKDVTNRLLSSHASSMQDPRTDVRKNLLHKGRTSQIRSLDLNQQILRINLCSRRNMDGSDDPVALRMQPRLHLHRLNRQQQLASRNLGAGCHRD